MSYINIKLFSDMSKAYLKKHLHVPRLHKAEVKHHPKLHSQMGIECRSGKKKKF